MVTTPIPTTRVGQPGGAVGIFRTLERDEQGEPEDRPTADPWHDHTRRRNARGLTLYDVAAALEVSVPTVSEIELDRRVPSEKLLRRIAVELELDSDELRASPGSSLTRRWTISRRTRLHSSSSLR